MSDSFVRKRRNVVEITGNCNITVDTTSAERTQNQQATSSLTTFTDNFEIQLDTDTSFRLVDASRANNPIVMEVIGQQSDGMIAYGPMVTLNSPITCTGGVSATGQVTADKFFTRGATTNQFVKGNGDLDASTYVKADGTVTMTGALNMGSKNVINAGVIAGDSLSLTTGTTSQFLLGNGTTISNASYPTISVQSANWVYNSVNIPFQARRIGVTGNGMVTIFMGGFSVSAASTTSTLISSSVLSSAFRPINALFFPCRIQKSGVNQLGCCIIYASGEIGFTDIAQTSNFWASGTANCGLAADFAVSYPTNNG
jgi:hypothetical protein